MNNPWVITLERGDAPAVDNQLARRVALLGSLIPELAEVRVRMHEVVEMTSSSLTPVERLAAALTTSVLNGATACAVELVERLHDLGVPHWLIESIQRNGGTWSVSDDDRLDVIVWYAAKLTRRPHYSTEGDIRRLRSMALTDLDIVDLNNIVAYYNFVNRVTLGLGETA